MDFIGRQNWNSRFWFILAAIGAAVGIGNLWRFPYLAFEYGGGAFLMAFAVGLLFLAIPFVIAEIAVGQKDGISLDSAFRKIKKCFGMFGWFIALVGGAVISYYTVVIAWGLYYLTRIHDQPWGTNVDDSSAFFFEDVLKLADNPGELGGVSLPILISVLVIWAFIFFALRNNVKSLQSVIAYTATIPLLTLLILAIGIVNLDGAMSGVVEFFTPDFPALKDPQLWLAAFTQAFFSASAALGIFVVYATYNKMDWNIINSTYWIILGDFIVSVLAGIVVFGTLGHFAVQQGVALSDVFEGGPGLVFVVLPVALSLVAPFLLYPFFVSFVFLGIDSAFALFEVFLSPFKRAFHKMSTKKLSSILLVPVVLGSIFFATNSGLYFLDIVDHFLVSYAVTVIAIIESILFGWLYHREIMDFVNKKQKMNIGKLWRFLVAIFAPISLILLLGYNIYSEFLEPYEGYDPNMLVAFAMVLLIALPLLGCFFGQRYDSRGLCD